MSRDGNSQSGQIEASALEIRPWFSSRPRMGKEQAQSGQRVGQEQAKAGKIPLRCC